MKKSSIPNSASVVSEAIKEAASKLKTMFSENGAEAPIPQLSFELNNLKAPDTIYLGDDQSLNKLTFTITTNVASTFTSSVPVPKSDAGSAEGSLIYLDLTPLEIKAEDFPKITCSATNWDWKGYDNNTLCFAPKKKIDLGSGTSDAIKIEIDKLIVRSSSVSSANLSVSYYRVAPISSGALPGMGIFKVLLQNPPSGSKDLHKNLVCGLYPFDFVTSIHGTDPVNNSFSLVFSPGTSPLQVKAGPKSKFIVSFVYADAEPGYGALCTATEAIAMSVKQGTNAASWKIDANTSAQNPSWTLSPPDGDPIVGSGVKSSVEINFGKLVTYFQGGTTIMYVQYQDIPGYEDGSYTLLMNKLPHVSIEELSVEPNPAVLTQGSAQVKISWMAKNAEKLMLMPFYEDVTGKTSSTQTLSQTTEITLIATGNGSPANEEVKTVKANVLPVINSFKGTPTNIYKNDYPHDAQFYWDVDTEEQVYLENSAGLKEPVAKTATAKKTLYSPNIWSVVPSNDKDYYKLKRDLLVRSFDTENVNRTMNFSPSALAVSPTASFIAAINPSDKKVHILNNLTYDDYTDPVEAGNDPTDVIFSNDGNFMFVTGGTDKNIMVYAIDYDNATSKYKFSKAQTIDLGSKPNRVGISADDDFVFITGTDSDEGKFCILTTGDPDPYQLDSTLTVGKSPQGIAVNPSGAQIYVANMGDNSISVIGYSPISSKFENVRTIKNVDGSPSDITLSGPDSSTLVVACKTTNEVLIMSPNDSGSSDRQQLKVGDSPTRLTSIPGYTFVSNNGSKDVSLLSTYSGIGKSKVLEKSIKVGANPTAIAASAEGNMVFVANRGEQSINVFNLINYEAKGSPATVGNGVNSTVVSSDGSNVISWCNVKSIIPRNKYDKGIFIYDTSSNTVDQKMDSDSIIDCIYHPDSSAETAYATIDTKNYISVLETQHYTESGQVQIPNGEGGVARCPENMTITPDGKVLTTLVKDTNGNFDLLVFDVDISDKKYTKKADVRVFSTTVNSNTVLLTANFDATAIAIISAVNQKVWIVTYSSGEYKLESKSYELKLFAKSMVMSPDAHHLYILSSMNTETAIDVVDIKAQVSQSYPLPASYETAINLQEMVISPDGEDLYITDANIAGIRVFNTQSLRIIQTLEYTQDVRYPSGITTTPDGLNLYFTGSNSGNLMWIGQIGYTKDHLELVRQAPTNFLASLDDVADDSYEGIFVRDYVGETTTDHSQGSWTTSPDIICNGTTPIKNIGTLTDQSNYDKGLPSTNTQTPKQENYVYVRGKNMNTATLKAKIWLYYVDTTIVLWPQNWKSNNIKGTYNKTKGIWDHGQEVDAKTAGEIVATSPGFLWTPPSTGIHYCLTAWVSNEPDTSAPDLYDVGTVNDMAKWILERPNVSWRNTIEVDATQPTIQDSGRIDGAKYGGLINVGVQLKNLPVGGEIEFSVQGDKPETTVVYPKTKISNPNAAITVQVNWTPGYNSSVVFKYYKGDTKPEDGANIIPIIGTMTTGNDFLAYAKRVCPQHVGEFQCFDSPEHLNECVANGTVEDVPIKELFIVGSVNFKLKS